MHAMHKARWCEKTVPTFNSGGLLGKAGAFDKLGKILPKCFVVHIPNIYDEGLSSIRGAILGRQEDVLDMVDSFFATSLDDSL